MIKLSIIMPVYNAQDFLSVSVDSIINQTLSNWELILINDGSKDDSLTICQDYSNKDSRIKVINKENGGAGPARNEGLKVATGEYITFVDADDWLEENAYSCLIDEIEKNGADMLLFGIRTHICDKNNKIIETREEKIESVKIIGQNKFRRAWAEMYNKFNMNSPCNKIYKNCIIKEHNLCFPALRRMQDGVFNLYYYEHVKSFVAISGNFYNRRWNYVDVQRKKMPKALLECALSHYNQSIKTLNDWDMATKENESIFLNKFIELIKNIEFVLLPIDGYEFINIYKHIKKINNNKQVHEILKKYKKLNGKLSKTESAMLYKLNLLLAIKTYRKNKA